MKRRFVAAPLGALLAGAIAGGSNLSVNAQDTVDPALMAAGQAVFASSCLGCHGAEGQGGAGPALANNEVLSSARAIAAQVLNGNEEHGMPAFADTLTDEAIAAVGTYIRNSWGNAYGAMVPETVAAQRGN